MESAQSLILAPLWGLQSAFDPLGAIWMTLANPIVLAGCGAVLFRLGVAIGLRRATASARHLSSVPLMAPLAHHRAVPWSLPRTLGTLVVVLGIVRWREGCGYAQATACPGAGQVLRFSSAFDTRCSCRGRGTRSPDVRVASEVEGNMAPMGSGACDPSRCGGSLAGVLQQPALRRAAARQLLRCSL